MQAIILAAGMGKRLGELTKSNTKCMVKVNGVPLIERMLSQLEKLQLQRIVMVVGYHAEELKSFVLSLNCKVPIIFVENPVYDKTNNIYSLALAKQYMLEEDTLLLESDLIFEDSLLDLLLSSPLPNIALVSKYHQWMDGTMVQIGNDCKITNFVPKTAFDFKNIDTYYKTVNIYKFTKKFCENVYVPFLEAYIKAFGNNEYYEQVLRAITILDKVDLFALPVENRKWYEIDDIQDLDIAEAKFSENGQRLKKLTGRFGGYWRFPNVVDFCYLVNPYFPTRKMRDEMKANFDVLLESYPSGMGVISMLAGKYFGLNSDCICVGNGAAELIKAFLERKGGKVGVILPSFEEYINRVGDCNSVVFIPNNDDFSYGVDDLFEFFNDKQIDTLILVNPDNPSGNFIKKNDVLRLLKWAFERNIAVLVDESFIDFAEGDKNTLLDKGILASNRNLYVIKSISKSYGVPGIRLGVLVSYDVEFITSLKNNMPIWNINSFAEFYMQVFNKYQNDYENVCELFKTERNRFFEKLSAIDSLRVIKSQANFFLVELTGKISSKTFSEKLLLDFNILVKDCSAKRGFAGRNYIRIAVRNRSDNDYLLESITKLLGK